MSYDAMPFYLHRFLVQPLVASQSLQCYWLMTASSERLHLPTTLFDCHFSFSKVNRFERTKDELHNHPDAAV
jgi:hypothetical protein